MFPEVRGRPVLPADGPCRGRDLDAGNAAMAPRAADKAKAEAKRKAQEKWRQRDREVRDIAQVNVRVPVGLKDHFKRFGELLRDGKKSWDEPPRVCRRLVSLSHAARAGASSWS
jgi:hypothetical protein